MSQRESGYKRIKDDLYETPNWVTQALWPHIHHIRRVLEPAAGNKAMVNALEKLGAHVTYSDISTGQDFLQLQKLRNVEAIITNPPYGKAQEFIEHALSLTQIDKGLVAMLLRTDYDHAKTRQHLFNAPCPFAKKVVLTKRIVWFERKGAAPSFNHAWFIWDWRHIGPPTLAYGP